MLRLFSCLENTAGVKLIQVWVRAVLVMCILYGVYFGILTRDVAEVFSVCFEA